MLSLDKRGPFPSFLLNYICVPFSFRRRPDVVVFVTAKTFVHDYMELKESFYWSERSLLRYKSNLDMYS